MLSHLRCALPCLALLLLLTACQGAPSGTSSSGPQNPPPEQSVIPPSSSSVQPTPAPSGPDQSQPGQAQPDQSTPVESNPIAPEIPPVESYDFTQPVGESEAVGVEYFDDAAFVGDSRTEGMLLYSGMTHGDKLTSTGMNIFKLADTKAIKIGGQEYTLLEALSLKQYGKVYLCLGINELGYRNDDGFYRHYCETIDAIRACQPNAVIYVETLIPLNEQVNAKVKGPSYLTNEHLMIYNDLIRQAAEEKQVALLDVYYAFEVDGSLPAEATKDGSHLTSPYCRQWMDYLMAHTVDFDTLYPDGIPETEANEG